MVDPQWLALARKNVGVAEIPGPKHSSVILGWLAALRAWWKDDETAWCGTFVAAMLQQAGMPIIANWFRARDWGQYGVPLNLAHLVPGTILVFAREGGGHVGFYVGEDAGAYHVLGGNQQNRVCTTRIGKSRLLAARWPKGQPVLGKPVWLKQDGTLSENEA